MIKGFNNETHAATPIGKIFQTDLGFVRGAYRQEDKSPDPLVTILDNCSAYPIIIVEFSRLM